MDRFDKFTDRARKVLTLAQDEAQRFNHNYIGTEHLLLGLVREGEGVAARVLENMNVELPKVRTAVEFIIGRGDRPVPGARAALSQLRSLLLAHPHGPVLVEAYAPPAGGRKLAHRRAQRVAKLLDSPKRVQVTADAAALRADGHLVVVLAAYGNPR